MEERYNTYSFMLNRTARRVKQFAQQKFKEFDFGITVDQWTVLKVLSENATMNQSELAKTTFKDTPTLTRILDLLVDKKLVERVMDQNDRRKFRVLLTLAGTEKVEEMKPKVAEIRKKAWNNLTTQDFDHFKMVLDTIYNNLNM